MGMSSSQVRLLALTARLHDVEFQAQSIQHSKMQLADSADAAYNEYVAALDETKYQMEVFTGTEFQFQDVTYQAMISSSMGSHHMYLLTDAFTDKVLLPESLDERLDDAETCDEFLDKVAATFKGEGFDRNELSPAELNYWRSVYYQMYSYQKDGKHVQGLGHKSIPDNVMTDGEWLQEMVENAYAVIRKMTLQEEKLINGDETTTFNIFADSSVTNDTSMREIPDTIKLKLAEAKYESDNRKIDQKESQLDMQLTKLETERKAITTEFDSVKKVINDNIERSFKTFNA